MRRYFHPSREDITLESVLYALSDPVRLSIVTSLADGGETSCGNFSTVLPKSTTSHHLRVLREAGVTRTRVQSTSAYISLRRDDMEDLFPGLLDSIIEASRARSAQSRAAGARPSGARSKGAALSTRKR